MDQETKTGVVKEYRLHELDSGSTEVQIALLTRRIGELAEHLRQHAKDFHTRRGLMVLVGQRRRFLRYLRRRDAGHYRRLIERLNIRQ
ncbi:MAG: 30S ribosomal protein S15 [Chloroflexi bacterium]|nr:30S ribosomal protein S15 [Chloroflexota bacterium]